MARFPQTGTVAKSYLPSMSETNPMRFSWDATHYTPASLGNGTAQLSFRAGFVTYNGRRSPQVTGELFYVDSVPPEIELTGDNPQHIMINTNYTELGALITDNLDPDIESKLEIDASEVDTSIAGTYTVTYSATDHAGNSAKTNTRTVIVETPPPITAEIEYSPSTTTNGNVTATLKPSEAVTVTNNGGSPTYTFSENGYFTFEFKNAAGNTGAAIAVVDWIDKTPPSATVSYSTTRPTNGDVVATITPSEPVTVTNTENGDLSHTFTQNGSFTFEFEDEAGNKGSVTATVSNIDKSLPTGTIGYDVTNFTNQNVTATLTVAPTIKILNNGGSNTHVFTENGSFEFEIQNVLGTKSTVAASVDWIDKEAPVLTLNGSESIELSCVETYEEKGAAVTDDQDGKIQKKLTIISTVREKIPGTYTVTYSVIDHAGNTAEKVRTVTVSHSLMQVSESAASCTKDGTAAHWACSECGKLFEDEQGATETTLEKLQLPQKGHTPGPKADCTHDQTCTVCGAVLAEKLGHDYKDTVTPPTCTEKGYTTHTCTRCGDSYTDHETAAKGHTPGEWQVVTPATAAQAGLKRKECTECHVVLETEVIPKKQPTIPSNPSRPSLEPDPEPEPSWENPFVDVAEQDWYYSAVRYASENGLFSGTSNTTFSPNDDMTRGMLATVIYRLANEPETAAEDLFHDVADGKYYTKAITWTARNGIVAGYGNNCFGPEDPVTREQLATILWRYAGCPTPTGKLDSFRDGRAASMYAIPALSWMVGEKLIVGKGSGILDPTGTATRAEVAAILSRSIKKGFPKQ